MSLRISLAALQQNARALRDLMSPALAAFVVKGNAYGHGMAQCARAVEPFAAKLCVFSIEEAVALRDAGITKPVMILGPLAPEHFDDALAASAEVALWDADRYAAHFSVAARRRNARAKVNLKLNTGLNRLGLEPADLSHAIERLSRLPEIGIEGIFSHLASAEEMDSPFTMLQLERFEAACAQAQPIMASLGIRPLRHIAASAAAMLWPQTRLDMARFGIALYGLLPSPQTRQAMDGQHLSLVPALRYEATLVARRTIAAGAPVGYGTTFHAPREMHLGIVPLGYADGIPRALSNRGAFSIAGSRCAIVGRVAMNMTVVDLTQAPEARAGSRVTLIGQDGESCISADDWAAWADTINYEIVTRMPATLERDYSGESLVQ